MSETIEEVHVKPVDDGFEVLGPRDHRGPGFADRDAAIRHARTMAPLVVVLDRQGEVEREVCSEDPLAALLAEHYAAPAGEMRKDRDCHWQIAERFSYGRRVGWFVEHDGYRYDGLADSRGEEGPYATYEAAVARLAEHLRAAIADLG